MIAVACALSVAAAAAAVGVGHGGARAVAVSNATCQFATAPAVHSLPGGFTGYTWKEPYRRELFQDGFIAGGSAYETYMAWLTTTIPRDFHGLNPLDQRACLIHREFSSLRLRVS
jgi:hypothetical protein